MPDDLNRRSFLAAAATCACALCPLSQSARADDGDDDDAPTKLPPPVPIGKTDVGPLSAYPKDGVSDKWAASRYFFVVREKGRLYALSAVCSHKAGLVKLNARGQMQCTKHKSVFDDAGDPTRGPATKSGPLMRLGISLDAKGQVQVDNGVKFDQDEWDDKGAFIPIK